jgi:transposase
MANSKYHLEPEMFREFHKGKTQKEIASMYDVTEQTVTRYRKKFDWDKRSRDLKQSNYGSIEKLTKMRDQNIENGDADAAWKAQKIIDSIEKDFDRLAYTIEIMDDFLAYLKQHHGKAFKIFQKILPDFLQSQRNKYKRGM